MHRLRPRALAARAALPCLLALALGSCSAIVTRLSRVPRQDLFRLDLGRMEDQVDLSDSTDSQGKLRIFMRDGLFFISDGGGRKIMKLSSYGDLLSLVYEPEHNPTPVLLNSQGENGALRRAFQHPLRAVGEIVVNSKKEFYVEDRLPPDRRVAGPDEDSVLDAVILRFDQDGSYRDYLGQEGPGGTPFPNVTALYCTAKDDIVALSATPSDILVNWFSDQGILLHSLSVDRMDLPMPPGGGGPFIASIEKIVPDISAAKLFMKIDYFVVAIDPSTKIETGIEYDSSLVWTIDPEDGRVYEPLKVPVVQRKETGSFGSRSYARTYEFLGVDKGGRYFFLMPEEDGSMILLVLDRRSGSMRRLALSPPKGDIRFSSLQLGSDGIISGIFASDREARVSWWRVDKAIGE